MFEKACSKSCARAWAATAALGKLGLSVRLGAERSRTTIACRYDRLIDRTRATEYPAPRSAPRSWRQERTLRFHGPGSVARRPSRPLQPSPRSPGSSQAPGCAATGQVFDVKEFSHGHTPIHLLFVRSFGQPVAVVETDRRVSDARLVPRAHPEERSFRDRRQRRSDRGARQVPRLR